MCHSCASSSPGNREFYYFLDSRFRGNDTPHPAWPLARPASPARGEASGFIRLKCYENTKYRGEQLPGCPKRL